MAVREFNGSTDTIHWAIDALSGMTFGTAAAIIKPVTTANAVHISAIHNSGGTFQATVLGYSTSGAVDRAFMFSGGFANSNNDSLNEGPWYLVVVRKATGSATPRFSIYNFTGATWAHQNGSTALGDWTSGGASGTIRTEVEGVERFHGRIATSALWSNEVHWSADTTGDAQIEAAGLEDSLQSWINEAPDALWAFNQASTSIAVDDLIANCDQTSLTGTTVIEGDDPPGFSFGAVPSAQMLPGPRVNLAGPGGFIKPWLGVVASEVATDTLAPAGIAEATGDALQPEATVAPNAGVASGTGDAPQPEATVAPNAGNAAAAGTAPQPAVHIQAKPVVASATGTTPQPEAEIGAKPGIAEAAGTAPQPTVSTSSATNAPAGLAAATGTAGAATASIRPNANVGLAAGIANQPAAHIRPNAGVGSGAGTAPQPTVQTAAFTDAPAGLAVAIGAANAPKIDLDINAGLAAAEGQAFPVFALTGNPLGPPQMVGPVSDDNHSLTTRDIASIAVDNDSSLTATDPAGLVAVDDDHSLEV